MNQFLVIVRSYSSNFDDPKAMQAMNARFGEWVQGVLKGNYLSGSPLERDGGRLLKSKKEVLTDGPFMDSKEVISGYFLIQANSIEEATGYAKECPLLDFAPLEVRQIKPMQ